MSVIIILIMVKSPLLDLDCEKTISLLRYIAGIAAFIGVPNIRRRFVGRRSLSFSLSFLLLSLPLFLGSFFREPFMTV